MKAVSLQLTVLAESIIAIVAQDYKDIGGTQCCDCEVSYCQGCDDYRAKCLSVSDTDYCAAPGGYAISYQGYSRTICEQQCSMQDGCVGFAIQKIEKQGDTNTSCLVYASSSLWPWDALNETLAPTSATWFVGTGGHDITHAKIARGYNGKIAFDGRTCFKKARCTGTSGCDSLLGPGHVCRWGLCMNRSALTTAAIPTTPTVATTSTLTTTTTQSKSMSSSLSVATAHGVACSIISFLSSIVALDSL